MFRSRRGSCEVSSAVQCRRVLVSQVFPWPVSCGKPRQAHGVIVLVLVCEWITSAADVDHLGGPSCSLTVLYSGRVGLICGFPCGHVSQNTLLARSVFLWQQFFASDQLCWVNSILNMYVVSCFTDVIFLNIVKYCETSFITYCETSFNFVLFFKEEDFLVVFLL